MSASVILVASSPDWTDRGLTSDAFNAARALIGWPAPESMLVHVAPGASVPLLTEEARLLGMNAGMPVAQAGAQQETLCIAFPTRGRMLATGEERPDQIWAAAEWASDAGIPTLVVWGKDLHPFGDAGRELLRRNAEQKGRTPGQRGQVSILDGWLPF